MCAYTLRRLSTRFSSSCCIPICLGGEQERVPGSYGHILGTKVKGATKVFETNKVCTQGLHHIIKTILGRDQ